jgi:hypothetical protein
VDRGRNGLTLRADVVVSVTTEPGRLVMRRLVWVALVAAAACGGRGNGSSQSNAPSVPLMQGFDPGPAPDPSAGFQIVLPVVNDIEPDGSYEYCTWTNVVLDHDIWIKSSLGMQTETGHHVVVFYTMTPAPPGQSRICNDSDMASFRFGIVGNGEGVEQKNTLPGDLAVHIPAGAQIVINHHYLNASAQAVPQAQSAVNVYYADPNAKRELASSIAFVDTAMSIATGQSSVDVTCTINNDYSTWYFIPHMHNWGTHITVQHLSGSTTKNLFDLDWDPSFAFHPPAMTMDPTQPYVLHKGDQLKVHCDYDNTTNAPLTFGAEMCVAFAQTVDDAGLGNMACNAGQWGAF